MIFWIDKNYKRYFKKEIDDNYLMNIAKALTRGVGDSNFVNSEIIQDVMEECFNRGLITSKEAMDMIDKAENAFERREICQWERLLGEIEFEEHAYGSDD